MTTTPARLVTVALIVGAVVMFSISTALERHDQTTGHGRQPSGGSATVTVWDQSGTGTGQAGAVWDVDVEATPLLVAAIVVSVALAVVLLVIAAPWVAAVIALIMLGFTALDILTVIHDVGRPGGAPGDVLAVMAMTLHVLACFTAAYAARPSPATLSR